MRLNQYLARAAAGSRREADGWIREGRVRVNGRHPDSIGVSVDPDRDRVTLDGTALRLPTEHRYYAYHKPRGVLVSRRSQGGRPTLYERLGPRGRGLHAVGRLDLESEGLLLLTDDGDLSEALLHPRTSLLRRYRIWVHPIPELRALQRMRAGAVIEGVRVTPERLVHEGVERGEGILVVDVREGKRREVRLLARSAGLSVNRLVRIQFGPVHLGTLRPGATRPLEPGEVAALRRHVYPERPPGATLR